MSRYKNKPFMQAVAAGCALVAAADGSVSSDEKAKMARFIQSSAELKVFDIAEVIKAFNDAVAKFEFDHDVGTAEALKVIGKIKGDGGAARLLVRVCCAIGASDGNFDEGERAMVRKMCAELGLPAADFDL